MEKEDIGMLIGKLADMELAERDAMEKTASMLCEFYPVLERLHLQMMISIEEWKSDTYGAVLAVYPTREGQVLQNRETGEISCAAAVLYENMPEKNEKGIEKEKAYIDRIYKQIKEILEKFGQERYEADGRETYRIGQEARFVRSV